MYILNNVKLSIKHSEKDILNKIVRTLNIKKEHIKSYEISKKSVDARKKESICYIYSFKIIFNSSVPKKVYKNKNLIKTKEYKYEFSSIKSHIRPIIVGSGPSGLFCAYVLAKSGLRPIVIERGKKVQGRIKDIQELMETGKLNINSNIQFGEGGAGTFSDGKLTTGVKDHRKSFIMETFVKMGGPKDILYSNKPHIGTDMLVDVVENLRNSIISLGGEFLFETCLVDIIHSNKEIKSIRVRDNEKTYNIDAKVLVLAIGHSSRDTFEMLYKKGIEIEEKPFAVGFRIEHRQDFINYSMYGNYKDELLAAEYKLAVNLENQNRSVYSFCMCPGGYVVPAQSEKNTIVTNGMSNYARNGENANSGILVSVNRNDFHKFTGDRGPLSGMYFQRQLEERAYEIGGKSCAAPVQLTTDYLNNVKSEKIGMVKPSFKPNICLANLNEIFPSELNQALHLGLKEMNNKIYGFTLNDSILTAVETRSSSPIRIFRDHEFNSNINGIIPCGEGCGYAGGITSSSIDGIKCAEKIIEFLKK